MKKFSITLILLLGVLFFTTPAKLQNTGIERLRETSSAFTHVARSISPSVVFIQVEETPLYTPYYSFPIPLDDVWLFGAELFERFLGERFGGTSKPKAPHKQAKIIGQGSGFIFASKESLFADKSYILTNNHLVEHAKKIDVILQDRRKFEATIVGTDPKFDIAVLEIKMNELPPLTLGDSSKVAMGEWVATIGNSFGLSHTLTVGSVSATGQNSLGIDDYENFIQTDTTTNYGSFGGPLVNLNGDVVGINTAILSKKSGYMGSSFAIPMNFANRIAKQLIAYQNVTRGHLGILIEEFSPKLIRPFDLNKNKGVLVTHVMKGSPAAHGGMKQGDIIIFFRGNPVSSTSEFRNLVTISSPNSSLALTVIRDDKRIKFNVTMDKFTLNTEQTFADEQPSEKLGFMVQNITAYLAEQLMIKSGQGVLITEVETGSIANMANIKIGSVILQVNRIKVENVNEFSRALKDTSKDKPVLLLIKTNNRQHYILLNWS